MSRSGPRIAGIVLAAALAGCSDPGVQEGPVPFKGTSTEPLNALKNEMKKNATTQAYAFKPDADGKPVHEPKAAENKAAEPKPAGDTKPVAETKAAEPKPAETKAAEPKPAPKN